MFFSLRKVLFSIIFNFSLFLVLIIGIQNSSKKSKVNFMIGETVSLPISFIIGISFITGSINGSFIDMNSKIRK